MQELRRWGRWGAALALLAIATPVSAQAPARGLDTALYAALLERHTAAVPDVAGTRIDYAGLADSVGWRRLMQGLSRARPRALTGSDARLAFWINAYNILAIDLVVRHRPQRSIRDIGNFLWPVWKRNAGRIDARQRSLDEIEHRILRPLGEPRIHAAIVCASVSCPSLRREPWRAAALPAQLDAALRAFLADPDKGAKLEPERGALRLSRIFDWFAEDFAAAGGVLAFVTPHLRENDRTWLAGRAEVRLEYFDYDWRLNDLSAAPTPP